MTNVKSNFYSQYLEYIQNDNILDKVEYDHLKQMNQEIQTEAQTNQDKAIQEEAEVAEVIIEELSSGPQTRTEVPIDMSNFQEFSIMEDFEPNELDLNFIFEPTYSEYETVEGSSLTEQLSNLSQFDNLGGERDSQFSRCATCMIGAYLLRGGDFTELAGKYDIEPQMTYENMHQLQQKLYQEANEDDDPYISSLYEPPELDAQKNIVSVVADGEIVTLANALGFTAEPILGQNKKTLYERSDKVQQLFQSDSDTILHVGVKWTSDGFQPVQATPHKKDKPTDQDHYIIIFKEKGKFMAHDLGQENASGNGVRELSWTEVENIVNAPASLVRLTK